MDARALCFAFFGFDNVVRFVAGEKVLNGCAFESGGHSDVDEYSAIADVSSIDEVGGKEAVDYRVLGVKPLGQPDELLRQG